MKLTNPDFQFDEKRRMIEWQQCSSEEYMTLENIVAISERGIERCQEDCLSRQICGEDACACVRSIFPTPQHYELYREARDFFLKTLAKATFAALISERIGDKTND